MLEKVNESVGLHFGCGPKRVDNFINVDGFSTKATDFCFDLRKRLPIPENSIQFIYSEHVLEHLDRKVLVDVLDGFYSMLRPGGVIRISVPDLEKFVAAYKNKDKDWFKVSHQSSVSYTPEKQIISPCEGLNSVFYNHMHRFIYDYETLEIMLRDAGFKEVCESTHLGSNYAELMLDSDYKSRYQASLFVEAVK